MKILLSFAVLLIMFGSAGATELLTSGGPTYEAVASGGRPEITITQNVNTTLIEPVQVSCGVAGTYTTQNWYLRRFYLLADHGITESLSVTSIDFGVEQLAMADGSEPPPYDIQVKVFSIPRASAFVFSEMTELDVATVTLTAADVGTIVVADFHGFEAVDSETSDLVVAIDAPDGSAIGAGLQFRPGANAQGALWDAYIATADCGITEPIAVSDIGFPDSQTIFVVNGIPGIPPPPPPDPIQSMSWGRVKELYR